MPYDIRWHVEKRVICERLYGALTVPDMQEASDATSRFLQEGKAPVHLIIDMSGVEKLPVTVRQATSLTRYLKDPNLGWLVLIGGNTFVNFMVSITSQVINYSYTKRESMEDAMRFLAKQDETLQVSEKPSA